MSIKHLEEEAREVKPWKHESAREAFRELIFEYFPAEAKCKCVKKHRAGSRQQ